eukprot:CAMPEP_0177792226 /NCGR_PEP_ID=MMETSP0491_2-20121128/24412_1 /TAXON_ID=63592 /ORGANISM="Tetraselmis chuii, Strain PLY429" /LENGTH=44 /DNA_ID= /DNA_START= /DNA_END= /DNA_ORIENTATION=
MRVKAMKIRHGLPMWHTSGVGLNGGNQAIASQPVAVLLGHALGA